MQQRIYLAGNEETIIVSVYYPKVDVDDDWICGNSVKWGEEIESIKHIPGIDALDALLRSVGMVRVRLRARAERNQLSLSWDGNPDLGLRG